MLKGHQQPYSAPHNTLDSTAPRIKRGKEREIPKVKRPTALKKVMIQVEVNHLGEMGERCYIVYIEIGKRNGDL